MPAKRAAPTIAELVAEANRKAEIERKKHEAEYLEGLKAERIRKRAEAQKASRESLTAAIEHWTRIRQSETFFVDVESRLEVVPDDRRAAVAERLRLARLMIGEPDALARLLSWKTPNELVPGGDES